MESCPNVQLNGEASLKRSIQARVDNFVAELIEEKPFLLHTGPSLKEKLYECENFLQLSVTLDVLMERKRTHLSSPEAVQSELQALPYGISNQVTSKAQNLPGWAKKALGWIIHAQRPVAIDELTAAIALIEDENTIKLDKSELLLDLSTDMQRIFDPLVKVENNQVFWKHECINRVIAGEQGCITDQHEVEDTAQRQTQHLDHWRITCILLKYLCSEDFIIS